MKANKIFLISLIISVSLGFIYTLIMLTDITVVDFFSDYLNSSVKEMTSQAQQTNQFLFYINLLAVLCVIPLLGMDVFKSELTKKRKIIFLSIGGILLVLFLISFIQTNLLYQLVERTDVSWKSPYVTQEDMGYVEPKNNYLLAGTILYALLILATAVHTVFYSTKLTIMFLKTRKTEVNEL